MFGGETGDAGELERLFFGEGVADLDGAVVMHANDIAGIGFLDVAAVLGHEDGGVGHVDVLADAVMTQFHAAGELAGTDAHEGDAVAMHRVHVRLDFKDEPGKGLFVGGHLAAGGLPGAGTGGQLDEGVEQFPHTEIVDGATEKDRGLIAFEVFL